MVEALDRVHDAGLVHGDLSAGNLLLRCKPLEDGQPLSLLLDFGLARLAGGSGSGKLAARCLAGRNAAPAILHRPVTTRVAAAMSKRQPVICR